MRVVTSSDFQKFRVSLLKADIPPLKNTCENPHLLIQLEQPPLTLKVLVATIDALGHFETG